ncbi:hypothetical protein DACRYDRAFT_96555 [Dacryopinax primogenitus]|uniref:Uncharacterized protein n=1 Tax=Dacryopinax primogenitus (strain DJM 731) TaxID=1858805 RepID=M5FSV0_DACPD|nr:uncharacterized protein DACRYDRAFT_96555 [Dacryopinax primogenitus]EJT98364.1 hypothetical protein DACRYDRAFT_96555 [Dacryopinax primogenitus]
MTLNIMWSRRNRGVNIFLSVASVLLFAITTTSIVLECNHILIGLLYTPGMGKDIYFENVGNPVQVAESSIALFVIIIGDGIMLYRVWMVWGRRWQFAAFNVLLWLGTIACSIRTVQLQAAYMGDQTNIGILIDEDNWTIATVVLSFSQTTVAMGLITYRIWTIDRASRQAKGDASLLPVIKIVVESGSVYMVFLLAYLVALVLQSPALLFLNQVTSPITSISFFLIMVRVGLSKQGTSHTTNPVPNPASSWAASSSIKNGCTAEMITEMN